MLVTAEVADGRQEAVARVAWPPSPVQITPIRVGGSEKRAENSEINRKSLCFKELYHNILSTFLLAYFRPMIDTLPYQLQFRSWKEVGMVIRQEEQSERKAAGHESVRGKISSIFFIQIFQSRCLLGKSVNPEADPNNPWCEVWYDRLSANLLLYGRSLGLTHSEAEDVLQDTFAALLKLKESPLQPQHYILRAYRNRSLNYRRNWWRRFRAEWESAQWFEPGPAENPKEAAAMRCLAELPVEQREVIVMKFWQKMTFEEIGQVLEISPNTAAGRFRYGVEKLERAMDELGKEESLELEAFMGKETNES